jgi:phosphoadenosine phosphosulfate reductase
MKLISTPKEKAVEKEESPAQQNVQVQAPVSTEKSEKHTLAMFTTEYLKHMNQVLSQQSLEAVLEWCCAALPELVQVTSFGSTGMVMIHALHKLNKKVPTVFLDTLYHFEETIEHAKDTQKKYGLALHWYHSRLASTRADFERIYDSKDMWISNPHKYEQLTKVEPLERALHELKVSSWMSGRRRDQGGLRNELQILEIDEVDGRLKVNPLAHWSKDEVWGYLKREGVPYNPLYDKSYTSIGDSVNTMKNADPSQGERAGRFYQFQEKTECGIHTRRKPQVVIPLTDQAPNSTPLIISS